MISRLYSRAMRRNSRSFMSGTASSCVKCVLRTQWRYSSKSTWPLSSLSAQAHCFRSRYSGTGRPWGIQAFRRMASTNSSRDSQPFESASSSWKSDMMLRTSCTGTLCFLLRVKHTDQDSERARSGQESVGLVAPESSEPLSSTTDSGRSCCCLRYSSWSCATLLGFKLRRPCRLLAAQSASKRSTRRGVGVGVGLKLGDFAGSSTEEMSEGACGDGGISTDSSAALFSFVAAEVAGTPAPGDALRRCCFCQR
mmetsp:Transcript_10390/g.25023  ORF Transcript_10390/g.25023 Transcript_10390/m.25023 type:complete len:253 (+) Transcript_10390:311-1069(+)